MLRGTGREWQYYKRRAFDEVLDLWLPFSLVSSSLSLSTFHLGPLIPVALRASRLPSYFLSRRTPYAPAIARPLISSNNARLPAVRGRLRRPDVPAARSAVVDCGVVAARAVVGAGAVVGRAVVGRASRSAVVGSAVVARAVVACAAFAELPFTLTV